jgi:hypothetical protein
MKKSLVLSVLVIAILLLGAVGYAAADTATVAGTLVGGHLQSVDTVTAKVSINPKLTLTVVTPGAAVQTVDFGTLDPGTVTGATAVNLTVSSNMPYNVSSAKSGSDVLMGLNTTLADSVANAKTASALYTDNYSLNVPWTTTPNAYTATVQYTVVQN